MFSLRCSSPICYLEGLTVEISDAPGVEFLLHFPSVSSWMFLLRDADDPEGPLHIFSQDKERLIQNLALFSNCF